VKSQDFNGDTPLHDAVKFGHVAVAKTLLAARAQV
jgi:ankyrin repeat protein